jgi:hypothetical protein
MSPAALPPVERAPSKRVNCDEPTKFEHATLLAMRDNKQCPKCKSLKIAMLPKVDRSGQFDHPAEAVVGFQETPNSGFFGEAQSYEGELASYVCTSCGFHEVYVHDPGKVPWNELKGLVWINGEAPESGGPFR